MQPDAQTTKRDSLAVSAGALEIANVIQGALEVFWFTFTFTFILLNFFSIIIIVLSNYYWNLTAVDMPQISILNDNWLTNRDVKGKNDDTVSVWF